MGYPIASTGMDRAAAAEGDAALSRKVAMPAMVASVLFVAGYYLPLLSIDGDSRSLSDGESATIWVWVIPAVIAFLAAVIARNGNAAAGTLASGVILGQTGFTVFELCLVHRFGEIVGFDDGISKGVGFWSLTLACALAIVTALMVLASLSTATRLSGESGVVGILGGLAFAGVPVALLLPENGLNLFTALDDGLLQLGLLAWALLAPVLGFGAMAARRRAGVAMGLGVALGHLGFSAAMAQTDEASGGGLGSLTTGHSAIYHASGIAAAVLAIVALALMSKAVATMPGEVPTSYGVGAAGSPTAAVAGQWAADPFGRHQYRWYDGAQWTAQVSSNGVVTHDAPVAAPAPPTMPAMPATPSMPATPATPVVPRDQWQPPQG